MCNWEQAWLAYEPIENQKNRNFFESVYTDQNGELVKTALQEIETASEKLFNIHIAKTEDRNKAGILLEINPTLDLEADHRLCKTSLFCGDQCYFHQ